MRFVPLRPCARERGAAKKPIVYVVVIDGLDGDAVEAGNAPFISGLFEGTGLVLPGSRSVIPAETNPTTPR